MAIDASRSNIYVLDDLFAIHFHGWMALFTRDTDVLTGQRKIRLRIVVEQCLLPCVGGMAGTAMRRSINFELSGVSVIVA